MDVQAGELPSMVSYSWDGAEHQSMDLPLPIGITQKGMEVFDLAVSPHLLVAGATGYGKSMFLHTMIHSLLPVSRIAIIDMKRLDFNYLKDHCIVAEIQEDALQLLQWLNKEMNRRIDILAEAGVRKIQQYHIAQVRKKEMPFIVCIIDEMAEIQDEKALGYLDRLVRMARAVGISIVAATQRTSVKVINGDTRSNFVARLCFQAADETSSRVILGENSPGAAHLPAIKGRAIFKYGIHEKEIQAMYIDVDNAYKLLPAPERWWDVANQTVKQPTKRLAPRKCQSKGAF